jgi:rare lipoprotein A
VTGVRNAGPGRGPVGDMVQRVEWVRSLLPVLALLVGACARPGGHEGYQNSPYTVRGQRYYPLSVEQALEYREVGVASWYDESSFFGLKRGDTSLGEKVMPWHMTGAHKTLPLPCQVRVTNLENGRSVRLRLNDRGPFIAGRIIDVTPKAAKRLGFKGEGLTQAEVEVLSVGDGSWKRRARRGWW